MRPFGKPSIRHKLVLLSLLTCAAVLVVAFSAFATFEAMQQRRALVAEITAIGAVIGHNSAAALLFEDQEDAKTTLSALRSTSYIRKAELLTPDGQTFVSLAFGDQGIPTRVGECAPHASPSAESSSVSFRERQGDLLDFCRVLIVDGLTVGTLHLVADMRKLNDALSTFVIAGAATTLVLLILAVPLSWMLQHMISAPITKLAHVMTCVARDKDYKIRIEKHGDDEVGTLIERFNDMLAQIGAHEASITAARLDAEASNRAISAFLANTSHELRTPLNAIIGFSEMIKSQVMGVASPTYVGYANDIWHSGTHLLQVINGLLDLSKIEAGKLELQTEPIDVAELLERTLRLAGDIAKSSERIIEVRISPDRMTLQADDRLIRQSLLNLLSNAIKFTPAGGRIVLQATADKDDCLLLSVSDDGIGIKSTDMGMILLPFGRVENAYNRKHDGTGLGLPLVKKFIELHGGRLQIDSEPGVGTTVTLRLPAYRLQVGPDAGRCAQAGRDGNRASEAADDRSPSGMPTAPILA
jgi:signal transduction histidine kinase